MQIQDNLCRLAQFVRTVDGDTFECVIDLAPPVRPKPLLMIHVRVFNWNAAELDETDGPVLKELFDQMLKRAKRIDVELKTMSFERVVSSVYLDKVLFVGILINHLHSLRTVRNRLTQMPNIPDLPDEYRAKTGVEMTAPPIEWLQPTTHMIMDAVKNADFSDGKHAVVTWVATTEGVNAAVVAKVVENEKIDFKIVGWVGKKWGEPIEAGIAGQVRF